MGNGKGKFQWWGDEAPCWTWGALCSPASPDHLFQPCFPHRSGEDYKCQYLEWNNHRRKSEICCRWPRQSRHLATWHAINVFGIVAYNNPNLDYISIITIPQPGYTDRLEDDTLSNKRYSVAWEKISLISILNFLQPSETFFFIHMTVTFMWLLCTCSSTVRQDFLCPTIWRRRCNDP